MIISEFKQDNRSANVCLQQKKWVTMLYENDSFIKELVAWTEEDAEVIADRWINHESI